MLLIGNRYHILNLIAGGTEGVQLLGQDQRTQRLCAVKVHRGTGSHFGRRIQRTVATLARVERSDHVAPILDFGIDEAIGRYFTVTPYYTGGSLATYIEANERLSSEEAMRLGAEIAIGVGALNAADIIYRDLKSENVMLHKDDHGCCHAVVIDPGSIKSLLTRATGARARSTVTGTPPTMSPEQLQGSPDIDARSDVYAFAHVKYHMLVGRYYWEDDVLDESLERLFCRKLMGLTDAASVRAARNGVVLPAAFDDAFATATALDPRDRFSSVTLAAAALAAALRT